MKGMVSIDEAAALARLIRDLEPGEWMARLNMVPPAGIEVRHTGTEKGRGVYALRDFAANQHVETCPVKVFLTPDFDSLPEELRERVFNWGILISKPENRYALCLGFGSFYNDTNDAQQPNLRYFGIRTTSQVTFVASRAIHVGDELTISYDVASGVVTSGTGSWMRRQKKPRL